MIYPDIQELLNLQSATVTGDSLLLQQQETRAFGWKVALFPPPETKKAIAVRTTEREPGWHQGINLHLLPADLHVLHLGFFQG